jgi:hypothetical protein
VEGALSAVGQKLKSVGVNNPRSNSFCAIDFRLKWQLHSYSKKDNPPSHLKPVPVQALLHALDLAHVHAMSKALPSLT